jgi:hypothetical protein
MTDVEPEPVESQTPEVPGPVEEEPEVPGPVEEEPEEPEEPGPLPEQNPQGEGPPPEQAPQHAYLSRRPQTGSETEPEPET